MPTVADLDLDAIRARADAATPGPWVKDGCEIGQPFAGMTEPPFRRWVGETLDIDDLEVSELNAVFVAHAREDVPALLDEVERLRAALNELYLGTSDSVARGFAEKVLRG